MIEIFQEDFASIDEYISYEYTSTSRNPGSYSHHIKRTINLSLPETLETAEDGRFVLLYVQNTGANGVMGLAGMSNSFKGNFIHHSFEIFLTVFFFFFGKAEKRCPSPRFDSVD